MRKTLAGLEEAGTTIFELLVVLGILGILLGIAMPSVGLQIANAELNRAAREVTSLLRRARAEAVNEQIPRYVTLGEKELQVYRCQPNAAFDDCVWQADGVPLTLGRSVTLTTPDAGHFPALADTPVTGQSVPQDAAYFSTRGGYKYASGTTGATYRIVITGGNQRTRRISIARNTGHSRLEGF